MILGDGAIRLEIARGNIYISSYHDMQLNANSYDVRLGENYYVGNSSLEESAMIDFTEPDDVRRFWGSPKKANRGIIVVPPRGNLLCHTMEIVSCYNNVVAEMRARSSIGRSCLSVCKCAGMGDVGYDNIWTMEITNFANCYVKLYVGMRVAQMVFHYVDKVEKSYSGNYGQEVWKPEDMIPKLKRS